LPAKLCANVVTIAAKGVPDGTNALHGDHFLQPDLYLPASV